MKRFLLVLSLILLCAAFAQAQGTVRFVWDYDPPLPSGFEMRLATVAGGPATITTDCGAAADKTCTVQNIPVGTFYARCYAYNIGVPVELKSYSDSSNEVLLTMPVKPAAPRMLSPTGGTVAMIIQVPDDKVMKIALSFDKKPEVP